MDLLVSYVLRMGRSFFLPIRIIYFVFALSILACLRSMIDKIIGKLLRLLFGNPKLWRMWVICLFTISILLLASCQRNVLPVVKVGVSPLSPVMALSHGLDIGQVFAAQFHGAWASGAPYPVFFFDVPKGTTKISVERVVYGIEPPLGGFHPRLVEVSQRIVWPRGATSLLLARDFVYDENSGILLMFNAFLDGSPLDTASYDVFSCPGVGIAYLGDARGVNIFYNCAVPISISYKELEKNDADRPTKAFFNWECEGDAYEVRAEMNWGKSDPVYKIDIISKLTAIIVRK